MALDSYVKRWAGTAFRHVPAGSPYDILDFRFAGRGLDNRWNYPGQPTLYLAGDYGIALAEFARHLRENRSPEIARQALVRKVYRLSVAVDRALDLGDVALWAELSLRDAPGCFLSRDVSRAVAQYLRQTTAAQAILVPSIAFLDDASRKVLVLFLEKLPSDPRQFLSLADFAGEFRVS